ncbi:MAG: hypothetical protein AAF969_12960 [Bacteroidota bacterium]
MKIILAFLIYISTMAPMLACELCKKNQPKGLEDVTHGAGPSGYIDYAISWGAVILVLITLFLSIKYLINPKETGSTHIKNRIAKGEI